ncbi:hypothetical protein SAY87_012094 [Trapa incisa]|uniref:Protein transport protein Sec24-like At3g07100 n=1 Tax=Trapa incisa TaxID=236973 RepID=A0AAN7H0M7_9MYRT|nr:hypothetical protein SAY87_012094 [Trapa incisa]
MGTENPAHPSYPGRPSTAPFGVPPPNARPFSPAPPMAGPGSSTFRPSMPSLSQPNVPHASSSSTAVTEAPGFQVCPPSFSSPSVISPPLPPSHVNQNPGSEPFQHFNTPQFSQNAQVPTARAPAVGHGPFGAPPSGQLSNQPPTYRPTQNLPSVSMGSPPHRATFPPPSGNVPPLPSFPRSSFQQSYPAADVSVPPSRPTVPPPISGYPNQQPNVLEPASVSQSPFATRPAGYGPSPQMPSPFQTHQGGYVEPPQGPAPLGMHSRDQMLHASPGPPSNAMYGLMEDFSSLSLGSAPGSLDPGIDPKALPRPLDGDVEPTSFTEMFPLNCHPRYLRLTTSAIPNSQSLTSRWHLPLGAVVCPLAEAPRGEEVPLVNFISTGIIRCRRCRTYINPYVTFTDTGRKWCCNLCSLLNDVPGDYYAPLDANGKRIDFDQRLELSEGSVEFVAPTEYMVRPPMPPLYFFLIDASVSAVRSGMIEVVAQTIRSCLDDLPGFPRTQIGFITYDSTIHFYNLKASLTQPQMMVVSDLDDISVPLPDDLLVNLSESKTVVETFLDSLPSLFQDNMNAESAFGPALKAAFMVMSQLGGKLLIFQNMLPSLGVGRLKLRGDDVRVYGTDKEPALRTPEDPFYKQMAADLTKYQIGVNVYAFNDKYTDIASLGTLAKYTGGQVYHYPAFQSAFHKEKLRHELARDLTRETAWEAVMRIRCGKGIRFTSFHGNFMLRSTDLLALPAVDCDKAYAMQLSLEETLLTTQTVYFQVALLYTASCGERRIRVHTAAARVVTDLGEMYRQADTGAVVSLFSRLAIEKTLLYKLEDTRTAVQQRIVKALREYRNLYAGQHRLGGRMIYPESLKYLLLYGLALCKSTALRGSYADASLDERSAAGFTMMALPVKTLLKLLYPRLLRVDEFLVKPSTSSNDAEVESIMKNRLPLTMDSLDSRGLYLFDDGFRFILWFGRMLSPEVSKNLLGQDFAADLLRVTFSERETEMSRKLCALLKKLRESDPSYYQLCYLVRQGEQPREGIILVNMVDDQLGGTNGYVDWTMQIHRQVQQNA